MPKNQEKPPLNELRQMWSKAWSFEPHARIGQAMLEKSLTFKTQNNLTPEQYARLDQLVKQYKRNPKCFDDGCAALKPGMRLVRNWKGVRHAVTVKTDGFDYQSLHYTSLTQIANDITGSKWNGRIFFGLKKKGAA